MRPFGKERSGAFPVEREPERRKRKGREEASETVMGERERKTSYVLKIDHITVFSNTVRTLLR